MTAGRFFGGRQIGASSCPKGSADAFLDGRNPSSIEHRIEDALKSLAQAIEICTV